jgi:anti-sigma B factor antagonist
MNGPDISPHSKTTGPYFDSQVSYRFGVPLIYVKGELDHDTASSLRKVIEQELSDSTEVLLLDFSELSYMDSGGLSLMFETVQRFKGSSWLGAVGANPGVRRLLELTGLVDHAGFRLFTDLRAASAALDASRDA